jgi:hypothetical protein
VLSNGRQEKAAPVSASPAAVLPRPLWQLSGLMINPPLMDGAGIFLPPKMMISLEVAIPLEFTKLIMRDRGNHPFGQLEV